jgi:hypothetical protein
MDVSAKWWPRCGGEYVMQVTPHWIIRRCSSPRPLALLLQASHEIGHSLGLLHHGLNDGGSTNIGYYSGG